MVRTPNFDEGAFTAPSDYERPPFVMPPSSSVCLPYDKDSELRESGGRSAFGTDVGANGSAGHRNCDRSSGVSACERHVSIVVEGVSQLELVSHVQDGGHIHADRR